MQIPFFDLYRQYAGLRTSMESVVTECLASCSYVEGPKVKELEKALQAYLGIQHAVTCGNGTDALKLALRAVGIKPGDEVITTPFTFFATAEAIASVGATPVFADVRRDDYCIDSSKIEPLITKKTRAILPVHIFGSLADMETINHIAKNYGLRVVEDACQAIGAMYNGKFAGTLSDVGCFSFYPTKNLGAYGDGGMAVTHDEDIACALRALKGHGAGKAGAEAAAFIYGKEETLTDVLPGESPLYDPYKYYNYLIADNSRLDSLQAAVLLVKLPHLNVFNARRAAIAAKYINGFQGTKLALPCFAKEGSSHCWHQFAVMTQEREALSAYLSEHGVGTGSFYPVPLHMQKAFSHLGYRTGDLPVAESLCSQSLCLPIYPELTDAEIDYVIDTILSFYKESHR